MGENMEKVVKQNGTQVQHQIDNMNQKLDLILEELEIQRQKRQALEDLLTDLNFIGNDLFKATVDELDHAGVEVDTEQLKNLFFRLLRNADTLNEMLQAAESLMDLANDAGPILRQIGLDGIKKMHDLEQKGYFEFFQAMAKIADNIVTHFTAEDVKLLADNIVTILETVKNMTQPEMLLAMNNAVSVYQKMNVDQVEEYSMWKAFKELRSPEMRRGIGFIMTFLKNISENNMDLNKSSK
jgi:uncharacterized protein YjgD (DUF1641 family)